MLIITQEADGSVCMQTDDMAEVVVIQPNELDSTIKTLQKMQGGALNPLLCLVGIHRWKSITFGYFDKCTGCRKLRCWYER